VGWMYTPHWSPDGQKVAVSWNRTDRIQQSLWVISPGDSSQKLVKKGYIHPVGWTPDGMWIYAAPWLRGELKIVKINPETGLEQEVFTLPFTQEEGFPVIESVNVSPDGKRFVFQVDKTNSDVWLIENFDPDVN
jgi:Tol biopolymer transport system component